MKLPKFQLFRKRSIWARKVLQVLFFILIAFISVNHTLVRNGGGFDFLSNASLHALCPFGGVETMAQLLMTGTLIQKVRASSVILLDLVLILSLLLGPVFCGWVCPLGTVQEWIGKLGRKWFGNKMYNQFIPHKLDRVLRYLRYGVLAWVLYVTFTSASLVFQNYDPYFALFNFWTGEVTITALLILESHSAPQPACGTPVVQVRLSVWRGAGNQQFVPLLHHPPRRRVMQLKRRRLLHALPDEY